MYFTAPRGNRVFYETFGNRARPPLLLIHGSTITGRQDYTIDSNLALRAAKSFYVIVPDSPDMAAAMPCGWLSLPPAIPTRHLQPIRWPARSSIRLPRWRKTSRHC